MSKILAVGSVAFDTIETKFGKVENTVGGSLSYFSSAAALFSEVYPVCVVGLDFPDPMKVWGNNRNLNLKFYKKVKGDTFRWGGKYHEDMDYRETLFTELGVFETFNPKIDMTDNIRYIFLGNIAPNLQLSLLDQLTGDHFISMDTMNFWIEGNYELVKKAVSRVDLLIINNEEIFQLTKNNDEEKAVMEIFSWGCKNLIIKRGKKGSTLFSKEIKINIGINRIDKVVDTTGAGDTFAGGLMGYLAYSTPSVNPSIDDIGTALKYGTAAASFAIEDFGLNRLSKINREDIEERVKKL